MTYYYSDPSRENNPHALPDVEVFYRTDAACKADGWEGGEGWYWWFCFPGCLPDGEAVGSFETEADALADMREMCDVHIAD